MRTTRITLFLCFFFTLAGNSQRIDWERTNGPYGYLTMNIVSNSSGELFLAAYQSGLYRSSNYGSTWNHVNMSLASNNGFRQVVINGKDELIVCDGNTGSISLDDGKSWKTLQKPAHVRYINSIAFDSKNDIWCATDKGLYYSTDAGKTLVPYTQTLQDSSLSQVYKHTNGYLYTSSYFNMYRSTDNGLSWLIVYPNKPNYQIGLQSGNNGDLFYLTYFSLSRSTDFGVTWSEIVFPAKQYFQEGFTCSPGGYLYAVLTSGVGRSSDNGSTWEVHNTGFLSSNNSTSHIYVDQNEYCYVTSINGVQRSTDNGMTWNESSDGLPGPWIDALVSTPLNVLLASDGYTPVFGSSNRGKSWSRSCAVSTPADVLQYEIDQDGVVYALTRNVLYQSDDGGVTWINLNKENSNIEYFCMTISKNHTIFLGSRGLMFFKKRNDSVWQWRHIPREPVDNILSIAADKDDNVYISEISQVYRSTDYGDNWQWCRISDDILPLGKIIVHPAGTIIIDAYWSLYRSADEGKTWSRSKDNISYVNCFTINSTGYLFAGSDWGVYCSTDAGDTWISCKNGLPDSDILAIALDQNDYMYAATRDSGIYKSIRPSYNIVPNAIFLADIFPNPVMQSTTIHFGIKHDAMIFVKVFNTMGQEVSSIAEGVYEAGTYHFNWSPSHLPSGLYFCRLHGWYSAGTSISSKDYVFSAVKKILYLK